jgi:hypothetical protein
MTYQEDTSILPTGQARTTACWVDLFCTSFFGHLWVVRMSASSPEECAPQRSHSESRLPKACEGASPCQGGAF